MRSIAGEDISFEDEEVVHYDKTNLGREEAKGEEGRDQSTEDVCNQTLFATCIDDLGITSQGLAMMKVSEGGSTQRLQDALQDERLRRQEVPHVSLAHHFASSESNGVERTIKPRFAASGGQGEGRFQEL